MASREQTSQSSSEVEWTIWSEPLGCALGSVGGREANEERLRLLEADAPGNFYLVCREIGPWTKPPRTPCAGGDHFYEVIRHLPGDGQGGLECVRCGSTMYPDRQLAKAILARQRDV